MISTSQYRICDVCRLLDFDISPKVSTYCGMCDAWICQEDTTKWSRRIKAAIKRKLEPGFRGDPDYTNKINENGELRA